MQLHVQICNSHMQGPTHVKMAKANNKKMVCLQTGYSTPKTSCIVLIFCMKTAPSHSAISPLSDNTHFIVLVVCVSHSSPILPPFIPSVTPLYPYHIPILSSLYPTHTTQQVQILRCCAGNTQCFAGKMSGTMCL